MQRNTEPEVQILLLRYFLNVILHDFKEYILHHISISNFNFVLSVQPTRFIGPLIRDAPYRKYQQATFHTAFISYYLWLNLLSRGLKVFSLNDKKAVVFHCFIKKNLNQWHIIKLFHFHYIWSYH